MSDTEPQDRQPEGQAAEAVQESPAANWPSPGQKLQKLREEMGLSHGRVADALHLTAHYVKALENDQYDKLPGKTFVKGYFRAYAKLLGANVEDILKCYEQFVSAIEESEESEAEVRRAKKAYDQNVRWMVCAAVIIIVVVGTSWWFARGGQEEQESQISRNSPVAQSPAENVLQTPAAPATAVRESAVTAEVLMANLDDRREAEKPAGMTGDEIIPGDDAGAAVNPDGENTTDESFSAAVTTIEATVEAVGDTGQTVAGDGDSEVTVLVESETGLPDYTVTQLDDNRMVQLESDGEDLLQVHFSGTSWIEVDNGDNTRLYNDMLDSGDDLTIRGKAPFNILVGDANVVDMTFNSRAVDLSARMRNDNSARIVLEPETN